ncbi:hypothetical protein [Desulfonatronovibrio magnus]|uniref:hypothetical protein n=1 Tax=Desulfonatronovibrio magnus TaxID=698827 RepID=UPI0005EB9B6B|nr:hypothetical protein [Desulfonatronovibrio magnus]
MRKFIVPGITGMLLMFLSACTQHHVTADTTHRVEIAPIHVTVDINLKVQRALDDALSFQGDMSDIFTEEELKMLQ